MLKICLKFQQIRIAKEGMKQDKVRKMFDKPGGTQKIGRYNKGYCAQSD